MTGAPTSAADIQIYFCHPTRPGNPVVVDAALAYKPIALCAKLGGGSSFEVDAARRGACGYAGGRLLIAKTEAPLTERPADWPVRRARPQ